VFKELIRRIAAGLEGLAIPYMIIGGQAVLFYGEPRFTKDIDITLGIDTSRLHDLVALLPRLDLKTLVDEIEDFTARTMVLPSMDPASGIRVDFIFSFSLYESQAIARAVTVMFDDTPVRIAALEDLIIHKVIAGRPRDMEDVSTLLLKNPEYDRAYIHQWLKRFDESLGENFTGRLVEVERGL